MSQLPPLLLERLKRRGIIKKVGESTPRDQTRPRSHTSRQQSNQANSLASFDTGEGDPDHEEILAEDYSDSSDDHNSPIKDFSIDARTDDRDLEDFEHEGDREGNHAGGDTATDEDQLEDGSVLGCPNKYNIYHECNKFCIEHYSCPDSVTPTLEQRKQLALVLRSYPLPNEWQVVYDPGVKTFYFWNIVTNLVSWLPPVMNGYMSISADEIRRSMNAAL